MEENMGWKNGTFVNAKRAGQYGNPADKKWIHVASRDELETRDPGNYSLRRSASFNTPSGLRTIIFQISARNRGEAVQKFNAAIERVVQEKPKSSEIHI